MNDVFSTSVKLYLEESKLPNLIMYTLSASGPDSPKNGKATL